MAEEEKEEGKEQPAPEGKKGGGFFHKFEAGFKKHWELYSALIGVAGLIIAYLIWKGGSGSSTTSTLPSTNPVDTSSFGNPLDTSGLPSGVVPGGSTDAGGDGGGGDTGNLFGDSGGYDHGHGGGSRGRYSDPTQLFGYAVGQQIASYAPTAQPFAASIGQRIASYAPTAQPFSAAAVQSPATQWSGPPPGTIAQQFSYPVVQYASTPTAPSAPVQQTRLSSGHVIAG